jgi:glutathione S-transferase
MNDRRVTLYHCPRSRSSGVLNLLEELQADYELQVLDMAAGETRTPGYLAINPMGKVPALVHGDAVVTEQSAVYIYLADLYADRGLAPALHDPLRGPYLRWMAFYGGAFEPAVVDRAQQRESGGLQMSPYGDYDTMIATLNAQLGGGAYMLGERFTALDVLWSNALGWTTQFGLVEVTPAMRDYLDRCMARPAFGVARERDAELAAAQSVT